MREFGIKINSSYLKYYSQNSLSGQELNIVTSAIILIIQGFISEAVEEFGRYNYLAMLDKYSSNCILMTPAKVLIKLIMPGLGLGRRERF